MIVAKNTEPNSWKKWHLIKMMVAKNIWTKQRRIKNAPYKNDCCQKNRSKTVEKRGTL